MPFTYKELNQHLAVEQKKYAAAKDPRAAPSRTTVFSGTYLGSGMTAHRLDADDNLLIASKGATAPQIERSNFFV